MNIKTKLKKRLLEIPINKQAFREKHRLANDLNISLRYIELYLNELCENNILIKKMQYRCPNCGYTIIIDKELLNEITEDGYFQCDNCITGFINPNENITKYVYYDIKNKNLLKKW